MERNRLYRADCKVVAEQLKAEGVKVDLIYLDPPFNSNRTYSMIFNHGGVTAQQKAFHDMWDFTDSTRQLVLDFRDELDKWDLPDAFKQFMAAWIRILEGGTGDDRKLLNYLMYMTQRLLRLRDILKPTGSIYFHCDPTASHYLKVIMDGVFGRENFRNEVSWKRTYSHGGARRWGPIHDTLLFYSASGSYTWNQIYQAYDPAYVEKYYRLTDSRGRYQLVSLTGSGTREGESGDPWRGVNPTDSGRHWAVPAKALERVAGDRDVSSLTVQEKLDILDSAGLIYWPPRGKVPRQKRYLDESPGVQLQDMVTDIGPVARGKERLGYATQKPLALLERIVLASSNPGDAVLDPFCGCGTSVHAAERHGRKWIGIDISGDAIDEIKDRMAEIDVYEGQHYEAHEGSPDTMAEYQRLNAFEKQDWLIRRVGGLPNPKKSGDGGKDGDMTFHMGTDADGNDIWGRMLFSVKTGKQRSPAHVRELAGTMKAEKAQMGVLIVDADPTPGMENAARKAGRFRYQPIVDLPPKSYDRIQIVTSYEIIDGAKLDCPPTMQAVKRYRKSQTEMFQ